MGIKEQESQLLQSYQYCMNQLTNRNDQVTAAQQAEFINEIKQLVKWGYFCFSVDLEKYVAGKTAEVMNDITGLTEHLGYFAKDFTLEKYHHALYPEFSYAHYQYAIALVTLLTEEDHGIRLSDNRNQVFAFKPLFTFIQCIRHFENDKILLVKRQLYPFQWNAKNQMTKYLNVFHVICEKPEGFSFQFLNTGESLEEKELYNRLIERVKKQFKIKNYFSIQELFILEKYIQSEFQISNIELVDKYNQKFGRKITLTDIKNIVSKSILPKAKTAFPIEQFTRMEQVAKYLAKHKLI